MLNLNDAVYVILEDGGKIVLRGFIIALHDDKVKIMDFDSRKRMCHWISRNVVVSAKKVRAVR